MYIKIFPIILKNFITVAKQLSLLNATAVLGKNNKFTLLSNESFALYRHVRKSRAVIGYRSSFIAYRFQEAVGIKVHLYASVK